MTKEEFDKLFISGDLAIRHYSQEEWNALCNYLILQDGYYYNSPTHSHDWVQYPYTIYQPSMESIDNTSNPNFRKVIHFEEFEEIITGHVDEIARDCYLGDIL